MVGRRIIAFEDNYETVVLEPLIQCQVAQALLFLVELAPVVVIAKRYGQIERTDDFGFEVDIRYRDMSLIDLREEIDREFYTLSEAHYERYMKSPDMFREQGQ